MHILYQGNPFNEYLSISKGVYLSADLAFIFVNHLDDETMFLTNYYQMHTGKTAIVVKRDAIFLTESIAHQVGHILGAGHGPDSSK